MAVNKTVILGMGKTGISCAHYYQQQKKAFVMVDSRMNPPCLDEFLTSFPNVDYELGGFREDTLLEADELVVSPGIDLANQSIQKAIAAGVNVRGDIDIFASIVKEPILAVTGSNGKSTVVTMVGEMLNHAGLANAVAGNIGLPVLDLLNLASKQIYVLELSSFQLETTHELGAEVACFLNLSADHMDRYNSLSSYQAAKQRIYTSARNIIYNRDDQWTHPVVETADIWSFGAGRPRGDRQFGLTSSNGKTFLAQGDRALLDVKELKIKGEHNHLNALASLAITSAVGLTPETVLEALKNFAGLPHRCQWVGSKKGIEFYNDSKGTNVGATSAAIKGMADSGKIILLAGGLGKGADFYELRPVVESFCKTVIVFGEDASLLQSALEDVTTVIAVDSLENAVQEACQTAETGDVVLLSPACASFDMFENFENRGLAFTQIVEAIH